MKDGGPAFPLDTNCRCNYGMSMRDYFAGQALMGMISCQDFMNDLIKQDHIESREDARKELSSEAYKYADAMIAERSDT